MVFFARLMSPELSANPPASRGDPFAKGPVPKGRSQAGLCYKTLLVGGTWVTSSPLLTSTDTSSDVFIPLHLFPPSDPYKMAFFCPGNEGFCASPAGAGWDGAGTEGHGPTLPVLSLWWWLLGLKNSPSLH